MQHPNIAIGINNKSSSLLDEHNSEESKIIMEKLENIDSETDNFDITFVKMADPATRGSGGDASARHRLLPAAIPQHLPGRPALGDGRARVAAQEPLPAAGAEHFHVRPDGDQYCIRCVHCIPAAVLQAPAHAAGSASEAAIGLLKFAHLSWRVLVAFLMVQILVKGGKPKYGPE